MSDTVFYVLSAVLSVAVLAGIHWMSKVETAVRGNRLSALAMLCAIILTFIKHDLLGIPDIWIGLAAGSLISVVIAKRTRMIAMPQLVGLLNGLGGFASAGAAILTLGFGRNIGAFDDHPFFYGEILDRRVMVVINGGHDHGLDVFQVFYLREAFLVNEDQPQQDPQQRSQQDAAAEENDLEMF